MSSYEENVARQPGGPFSNRAERRLIRWASEHVAQGERYSEERRRRFSAYGWWVGIGAPIFLAAIKVVEALAGKGH